MRPCRFAILGPDMEIPPEYDITVDLLDLADDCGDEDVSLRNLLAHAAIEIRQLREELMMVQDISDKLIHDLTCHDSPCSLCGEGMIE